MAEMIYTTATIGGKLTRKHAQELADIIDDEFLDMYNEDTTINMILAAAKEGKSLVVAGNVNYGEPDETRNYLERKRMPHVVTYCAGGEFNAAGYAYRNGKTISFDADDSGRPVVTVQGLKKAEAEGKTLKKVLKEIEACQHEKVPAIVLKD